MREFEVTLEFTHPFDIITRRFRARSQGALERHLARTWEKVGWRVQEILEVD